ncbi:MAG: hypothetical protein GKR89_19665 [Candidatus Latescibacteria bacterium]|nr:hypothetical protein [Candidatus Latescibacterota bacterium]
MLRNYLKLAASKATQWGNWREVAEEAIEVGQIALLAVLSGWALVDAVRPICCP